MRTTLIVDPIPARSPRPAWVASPATYGRRIPYRGLNAGENKKGQTIKYRSANLCASWGGWWGDQPTSGARRKSLFFFVFFSTPMLKEGALIGTR